MNKRILALVVALALVAVLAVPMAALAATSTDITGTVPKAVEVSAPANFAMDSLTPLSSPITSAAKTATVNANSANWTLTVQESGGGVDGKMYSTSGNLTSAMTVQGGDQLSYTSLAAAVALETGTDSAAGEGLAITDILFRQAIGWADVPAAYTITVVFTISPGA